MGRWHGSAAAAAAAVRCPPLARALRLMIYYGRRHRQYVGAESILL